MNFSKEFPQCQVHSMRKVVHDYNRRTFEKECALRQARVTLAFENHRLPNYVTEKMFEALRAGSVPVYTGAPDVKELLPDPSAAIHLSDFDTVEAAARYVKQVLANETLWNYHQAWRTRSFSKGFKEVLRVQCDSLFCRLCDWVRSQKENTTFVDTSYE